MTSVVRLRPTCPCGCHHPPGTPCPPSCDPCAPSSRPQMPMGVTDGSNALPGQVGEFITATTAIAFQQGVTLTTTISVITMPPGDWDAQAFAQFTAVIDACTFFLQPTPPGVNTGMGNQFQEAAGTVGEATMLGGPFTRINVTVPTALTFYVLVESSVNSGVMYLNVNARRAR